MSSSSFCIVKVHFDDVSLYGTPKEEPLPNMPSSSEKPSSNFLKNQLQAWFQPTDNRLAMKLFGSKKALVKERIRQKTAGHWVIHPCSSFRWVICLYKSHFKHTFRLQNNRKIFEKNANSRQNRFCIQFVISKHSPSIANRMFQEGRQEGVEISWINKFAVC